MTLTLVLLSLDLSPIAARSTHKHRCSFVLYKYNPATQLNIYQQSLCKCKGTFVLRSKNTMLRILPIFNGHLPKLRSFAVASKRSVKFDATKLRSTAVLADKIGDNGANSFVPDTDKKSISFSDPQIAYKSKSTRELLRAYLVFKLCGIKFLINNQYRILKWTRRLMGKTLFRRLMAATVYGQFMAGENDDTVLRSIKKHHSYNVQSMLNYTAMETHGFTIDSRDNINEEELWKDTIKEVHNSVALGAKFLERKLVCEHQEYATVALKLTVLASLDVLTAMNRVIDTNTQLIEEAVQTQDKLLLQCLDTVNSESKTLAQRFGLPTHSNTRESSRWLSAATNQAFHLAAMNNKDLTQIAKERGYRQGEPLSQEHLDQLIRLFNWITEAAQKAEDSGVRLAVDAEQSYLQLTLDLFTLDLMRRHNTQRPVMFNTYQCYRTRTHDILCRDLQIAEDEGFTHGSKVVRGGYMDEERRLAAEQGYPDPINPSYDATTEMYYRVADELLSRIRGDPSRKRVQVVFATHSEETVKYIVNRMSEEKMTPDGNTVLFGQLYGMRDHISFSLGHAGIPAAKMVHYGPIDQGMAYLSRRLTENKGGVETADRERQMVGAELWRRIKTGQIVHRA